MAFYVSEPASVTLDIDDTCDVAHGHQQPLFNGFVRTLLPADPLCSLTTPDARAGGPSCCLGKTPSGVEVRGHLRRLVRHIRARWKTTRITLPGRWSRGHARPADGLVRGERRGLRVRADRDAGAGEESRRDGLLATGIERAVADKAAARRRRPAARHRAGRGAAKAAPSPRHRGHEARNRHSLRRHQHRNRNAPVATTRSIARAAKPRT